MSKIKKLIILTMVVIIAFSAIPNAAFANFNNHHDSRQYPSQHYQYPNRAGLGCPGYRPAPYPYYRPYDNYRNDNYGEVIGMMIAGVILNGVIQSNNQPQQPQVIVVPQVQQPQVISTPQVIQQYPIEIKSESNVMRYTDGTVRTEKITVYQEANGQKIKNTVITINYSNGSKETKESNVIYND